MLDILKFLADLSPGQTIRLIVAVMLWQAAILPPLAVLVAPWQAKVRKPPNTSGGLSVQ
jgi:hypothetical protein